MRFRKAELFMLVMLFSMIGRNSNAQVLPKGDLIYQNSLAEEGLVAEWRMEGAGKLQFDSTGMHMFSDAQSGHHVLWCPIEFPESFIAEWELRNEHIEAGLCIVFFSAQGKKGQSIFDASIKSRDGTFKQYTKGDINNYHISFYANTPTQKNRPFSHLRKNAGFHKVQVGKPGIPSNSEEWHQVTLIKNGSHISMMLDDVVIVDWIDDGFQYGPALGIGHIGFRQMKWTRFCYRNFKVWSFD